jgi:hypothetical protein
MREVCSLTIFCEYLFSGDCLVCNRSVWVANDTAYQVMDHHPSADDGSAIGATVAVADLLFDADDAQRSPRPVAWLTTKSGNMPLHT